MHSLGEKHLKFINKVTQNFCNSLVMKGTIQQVWILLPKSWNWWTTLDGETLSSPDTLLVLLTGFISMAWSTDLKSIMLGLPDLAWSSRFLQLSKIFWTNLLLDLYFSHSNCFC